jgi:hypothetical protein
MTAPRPSLLRSALARMSVRGVAAQIGLLLVVFLLAVLWLRIPDASALDVAASALLGLLTLAIAGAGQANLFLRLCGRPAPWRIRIRGALLVLAGIGLALGWWLLLSRWRGNDYEVSGYLNSILPHGMRHFCTYERIALWLSWFWTTVTWLGAGVVAICVFAGTAAAHPIRAILRTLRLGAWWIALLMGTGSATILTNALVEWTPGHGLGIELLSLILRLFTVILFDALVACFLLAVLASCLLDSDARYETGTPDESHPRTAGNP